MLFGFPPFMVDPSKHFGVTEQRLIYDKINNGFTAKVLPGFGAWFPQKLPISSDARDFISKLLHNNEADRLVAKEALEHPWIINNIDKLNKTVFNKQRMTSLNDISKIVSNNNRKNTKSNSIDSSTSSNSEGSRIVVNHNIGENNNNNNDSGNDTCSEDEKERVNTCDDIVNKGIISEFANFTQSQGFKYAVTALFREQFVAMRPSHFNDLKRFFIKLDTDGNGKVSLKEFEDGISNLSLNLNKEQIQTFFKELDMQNGGEIGMFVCN